MDKLTQLCGVLLDRWQQATLMDYGHLILAVVLLGWFITRYHR